ncbi:hypothetical protein MBLNU457_7101t3 [Dothideomycetes sp. NU457]
MDTAALSPQSHDGNVKHDEQPPQPIATADAPTTAPASALTPPTSDDMNSHKHDDNASELSDLNDLDDDDELYAPDHYYGGGKIPVFKPKMAQFHDFKKYMERIDKYGMKSGIVKVIPPPEWREDLPKLNELIKTIKIKNPIMQEFVGTHGVYTQNNIEKQRSYNLPEWKNLTDEPFNQPPARRGERRRNQEKVVRGAGSLRGRGGAKTEANTDAPKEKRKPGRPRRNPLPKVEETEDQNSTEVPATASTPDAKDAAQSIEDAPTPAKRGPGRPARGGRGGARGGRGGRGGGGGGGRGGRGGQKTSVASRRMNNTADASGYVDEAAFVDFDWNLDNLDEFTAERCSELETAYWKSLTFAQPMYAADMPGSLFTDDVQNWNVAKLPNLLDVLGTKVPGVNTAYLYMGMWKATFAWHLEDVDLYSINYIHFGAPKQWYSISQEDARRFEAAMKAVWPNDAKHCDQFLRHKTYLISPALLKEKYNIEVNRLVHHEGEFVITYPYGYHSGYNLGYNCAESVNFALDNWPEYGRIARKCECEADSVWVDVDEIERKLRGEPTPEYYEETDDEDDGVTEEVDHLPSPPASVKAKGKPGRKRKRDVKDVGPEKKKKKIRILIKRPTREPCVMCPNDALWEPLLQTDNGKKAHRSCALYTPETWISNENGVETVHGVTNIDKARLDLKCNFCRSKRGACFQCASKKCTRAFHATCAVAAGVLVDCGPVPTFGEDGTEYFEEGFDFRCRFHRPRRAKNTDSESLEGNKLVTNYAKSLRPQDLVQVQYLGGEVFGGLVLENRPSECSVLVEVLPDGDKVEVEWKLLVVLNPDDSQRPKPSANAVPMPADMNKQSVSIENRQDGIPKVDDVFHEGDANKWAEFYNLDMPPQGHRTAVIKNPDQAKADISKPEQLYYYLPKHSTETKSKFTDDPASNNPVTHADFLTRVKPPVPSYVRPPVPAQGPPQAYPQPLQPTANRPYLYKPKAPTAQGNPGVYGMSQTPYAGQGVPQSQAEGQLQGQPQGQPPMYASRQFPEDAYYSSRTLPAAFPGQYSNYVQHVRQNSSHDQRRPSFSASATAPHPHAHPGGSSHGQLQKAPEFAAQPQAVPPRPYTEESRQAARQASNGWTPPSQLYHTQSRDSAPYAATYMPNPAQAARPAAIHSSAQDFQQQIAQQSSSGYANQQRPTNVTQQRQPYQAMQQYQHTFKAYPYTQNPSKGQAQPFEQSSPKQPTPSPLSEANGRTPQLGPVSPCPNPWAAAASAVAPTSKVPPYAGPQTIPTERQG